MQSKCLQPKTSIFQLKSLLGKIKVKKRKEKKKKRKKGKRKKISKEGNNQKAFDDSVSALLVGLLSNRLKSIRVFHTCSKLGFINFHHTDFKNGMKLTARKGTGDFKFKLS